MKRRMDFVGVNDDGAMVFRDPDPESLRERLAKAWDEGYEEGADDLFGSRYSNPYREEREP